MAVSTGNQRRKTEGREYDMPPPLPCTPKEMDVLLDKWIADGIFKPNQVSREPTEEERRDLLPLAQLRTTSHRRMLGASQAGAPQD